MNDEIIYDACIRETHRRGRYHFIRQGLNEWWEVKFNGGEVRAVQFDELSRLFSEAASRGSRLASKWEGALDSTCDMQGETPLVTGSSARK